MGKDDGSGNIIPIGKKSLLTFPTTSSVATQSISSLPCLVARQMIQIPHLSKRRKYKIEATLQQARLQSLQLMAKSGIY